MTKCRARMGQRRIFCVATGKRPMSKGSPGIVPISEVWNSVHDSKWCCGGFDVQLPLLRTWLNSAEWPNLFSPIATKLACRDNGEGGGVGGGVGRRGGEKRGRSWLLQIERNWGCGNSGTSALSDCWGWVVNLFYCLCGVEKCWRWVHWQRGVGCLGSHGSYLMARKPPWEQNGQPPIVNIMQIAQG